MKINEDSSIKILNSVYLKQTLEQKLNTTENILILDLNNIKTVFKLSTFYLRKLITMYK